jgi:hypothetical protein
MHKSLMIVLTLLIVLGCSPPVELHFISVGNEEHPPKSKDYEVQVFYDDALPESEYKVIGMVFLEDESSVVLPVLVTDSKTIKLFKKEAKERGADAIIVKKISSGSELVPDAEALLQVSATKLKRAEAQVIVFVGDNNSHK